VPENDNFRSRFTDYARKFPDAVAAALYQEMLIEHAEIQRRTPVDTGALRASEHVETPKIAQNTISCSVVAGGPSAPYAVIVHEDLEAFHRVGQAKFIESVLTESGPYMMDRIGRRLKV
jgi:hypothetical protein